MEKIRSYIKIHKMKLTELSEKMGCAVSHLGGIIHNRLRPSHGMKRLLLLALTETMQERIKTQGLVLNQLNRDLEELGDIGTEMIEKKWIHRDSKKRGSKKRYEVNKK